MAVAVVCAVLSAAPRLSIQEPGVVEQPAAQIGWAEKLKRDQRVTFTRRSGSDASKDIDAKLLSLEQIAAAMIAIGSTRPLVMSERPLVEAFAMDGTAMQRRAAMLALGCFGESTQWLLGDYLKDSDESVRACAMLGLLLTKQKAARKIVEGIAASGGIDGHLASDLLVFSVDPTGSNRTDAAEFLLDMRWNAARRYGLIDGESWNTRMLRELIATPRFLDAVVLGAVAERTDLGVKDHILARLIEVDRDVELRASTIAMPDELAALIESGLWKPRGNRSWRMMLWQIDESEGESDSLSLLSLAIEVPAVQVYALKLLARAGLPEPLIGLEEDWGGMNTQDRILACEAWAIAADSRSLSFMREFAMDDEPSVRASLMVAQSRLGDIDAHSNFQLILGDQLHADFAVTVEAAVRQASAPLVRSHLEGLLPKLDASSDDYLSVALALTENDVSEGRDALASVLREGFPPGGRGARCVRALVGRDAAAHIDLFLRYFPAEDDLLLNIALGRAIIAAQDDMALRFLRPALWKGSFDLSVLAGLVIVRMHGLYALREEITLAPLNVRVEDFRRVGFALGEWGGVQEVNHMMGREGLLPNSPVLQGALLGALGKRTH
ncbi:MAG: hypothetical protein ACI8X5_000392 [Planctomycetota bacterium]|jgi:hypothetical protein